MERLMIWAMRHPALVLLLTCVVSLLAVMQLPKLQIALSPQSLIIQGDPKQAIYDDMRDTFGSDRITVVYLADPDLLTPSKLREVSRVVETIEQLPFVAKTRSLFMSTGTSRRRAAAGASPSLLEPIRKPSGTGSFCGVFGAKCACPPLRKRFSDRL